MQQLTVRSIDVRNSSFTISDDNSTNKQIDQNHLHNFINILPQQVRRIFRHPFHLKYPDQQTPQNTTKPKPYSQPKDNQLSQEMGLIQNYLGSHNKFKTYFKSKKYKKIYQELAKQLPLEKSYYCLYMQDKFYALNKHIKISLVHKQTSFQEYLGPYFDAGKALIKEFYRYFLVDDELYKGTKKVNNEVIITNAYGKSSNVCQFLYITVTFLYQLAIYYRSKNQRIQAQLYYEANLKIVYKILQSSTSSSSLRRKISQYLISFSSFLIENRQLLKAQRILQLALQNCINQIAIIETKLKYCSKGKNLINDTDLTYERFKKRTTIKLKQAFQFMMAIYLNSSVVFQLQNKDNLSYLALNEVRYIEQILYKNYSIKSRIIQVIKKPKQAYDYQHQKIHIAKCYFDMKMILKRQKEQKQMKYNENVAIYGLTKASQISFIQSKDLMEFFFYDQRKKKQRSQKRKTSIVASKIGLIEYDTPCSNKHDITEPAFRYTINMKPINGSQSTAVYNQFQQIKQKITQTDQLSSELGVRRERKKLSKFYNLVNSENEISQKGSTNNKIDPNSNKEFRKSQKTNKTLKSQKMDLPHQKPQQIVQQAKAQDKEMDFLNKLIDSEVSIKRYFLYGKDFVNKYDLLSKGKIFNTKKDQQNREKNNSQYQKQNKKRIQYQTKDKIQILGYKDTIKHITKHNNSTTLLKKNRTQLRQPFNNSQSNQKQPVYIVSTNKKKFYDQLTPKDNNQKPKKRPSTSLKYEPMGYKQVMDKMDKIQNDFLRKDYIEKNSIYRLKCRSQNSSGSNLELAQLTSDSLGKGVMLNTIKREDQREAIMLKHENTQKVNAFLKDQVKGGHLAKKTLNSNLFSNTQTGIRLLKKIIFKHKKTLKITKPDLFVNYNKSQTRQEEIKLVERDSLLMVQYQMCQEETKARIKENMKQLIADNLRNSQENQKRVQKLNKAISEYDKNQRNNQFSTKMRQDYDTRAHHGMEKFMLEHNSKYFKDTFSKKGSNEQRKDSLTAQTDEILRTIFQKRILLSQTDHNPMGLGGNQKFLTGNKTSNPNLFLSSIKYKEDEKGCKKIKTFKNTNKVEKENKVLDESELHEIEEDQVKTDGIEKLLSLFKENLQENNHASKVPKGKRI